MKILILGGTHFLGRHLCGQALSEGHDVTLLNRGVSHPDFFKENVGVKQIFADRNQEFEIEAIDSYDKIVDCSGHFPDWVERSCKFFKTKTKEYIYISSVSVYQDLSLEVINESSPTVRVEGDLKSNSPKTYGARKKACEEIVVNYFGAKAVILRPGLIVGPYDKTWRYLYWLERFSRGGDILVPDFLNEGIQLLSVRDLASFILKTSFLEAPTILNTVGTMKKLNFGEFLKELSGYFSSSRRIVKASEKFLLENKVAPWTILPLWVPSSMMGIHRVDGHLAEVEGLTHSTTLEVINQTWQWFKSEGANHPINTGLKSDIEMELLSKLSE